MVLYVVDWIKFGWLYCFLYSQFWAQRGVHIVTWTVNDGREKDYFKLLGVPFMTDTLETWSYTYITIIVVKWQLSCKVRSVTIFNHTLNNDSFCASKYSSGEQYITIIYCNYHLPTIKKSWVILSDGQNNKFVKNISMYVLYI